MYSATLLKLSNTFFLLILTSITQQISPDNLPDELYEPLLTFSARISDLVLSEAINYGVLAPILLISVFIVLEVVGVGVISLAGR